MRVTAAVIVEGGKLLLARRGPAEKLAGMWELPGGKIETGESPQECLHRELNEELAMEAEIGQVLATTVYHYDHGSFELLAIKARITSGYTLRVHDAVAWTAVREIDELPLAPADVQLLALLTRQGDL